MFIDKTDPFYEQINNTKNAFTHMGKFHADDVFSYALLKIINPQLQIFRVKQITDEMQGIVFDIGWKQFDHHQKDARIRDNGVPYAAFGLLWEQAGTIFFEKEIAGKFDKKFVQPLDQNDNTGEFNEIAALIGDFNPSWNQKKDMDHSFLKAVDFAKDILTNKIEHMQANVVADSTISKYIEVARDDILILDEYIPWRKAIENTSIKFVIFPSDRGGFNAMTVKDPLTKEAKVDFKKEWYGKNKEELVEDSKIETLHFCHKSGFMIAAGTKEDAFQACVMSIQAQSVFDRTKKKIKHMRKALFSLKKKK